MKEFKYSNEKAKKVMKTQMITKIPLILIASFAGLYIANSKNNMIFSNKLVLSLTLLICLIAVSIGLFLGIKNGTKMLLQNIYKVTETSIERVTPSGKSINIAFNTIDNHKIHKKGLLISAKKKNILIPIELDEYNVLSTLILKQIK